MKKLITMIVMFALLSSLTFAAVQRSQPGADNTITYTTTSLTQGSYTKAYWAVDENVASCDVESVSCSGTNVDCSYVGGAIRMVSYTPEGGGSITKSVMITVQGTGDCSLTSGQAVESWPGNLGSATTVTGSATLQLGSQCNTDADTDCNGIVSDNEILSYASIWLSGSISDTQLLQAASAWLNG